VNEITTRKFQRKPPWWRWYEPPSWWPGRLHAATCTHCRHLARYHKDRSQGGTDMGITKRIARRREPKARCRCSGWPHNGYCPRNRSSRKSRRLTGPN